MARSTTHDRVRVRVGALLCGGGATLWDGCMVEPGRLGARQGRVPVPHSTAPITLGGCPRGVAGMGPGLTRGGGGRVLPGVGPCRFMAARHGTISPTLRSGVPL